MELKGFYVPCKKQRARQRRNSPDTSRLINIFFFALFPIVLFFHHSFKSLPTPISESLAAKGLIINFFK